MQKVKKHLSEKNKEYRRNYYRNNITYFQNYRKQHKDKIKQYLTNYRRLHLVESATYRDKNRELHRMLDKKNSEKLKIEILYKYSHPIIRLLNVRFVIMMILIH